MNNITKKELALLKSFVDAALEDLSNAGCNDFYFPKSWSKAERTVFSQKVYDLMGIDADDSLRDDECGADFMVFEYLFTIAYKQLEKQAS